MNNTTQLTEIFSTTYDPTEEGRLKILGLASQIAELSPDPFRKVGCICCFPSWEQGKSDGKYGSRLRAYAVGANHYNGREPLLMMPDEDLEGFRARRRPYVIHAEIDLISRIPDREQRVLQLFTTLFPCVHCMTALAAFNFNEVHYLEIYDKDKDALKVAEHYGIQCIEYDI